MGGTPSEGLQRLRAALLGSFAGTGVVEPVEATFRHVINQLSGTGLVASLDEETVTGALLGGFATAFPVCLGAFTESAEEAERIAAQNQCAWGQYSKMRTGNPVHNESDVGADFALVVFASPDRARIALFQAKRLEGARPNKNTTSKLVDIVTLRNPSVFASLPIIEGIEPKSHFINVRRLPGSTSSDNQMVVLERTGQRMMVARSFKGDAKKVAVLLNKMKVLDKPLVARPREKNESEEKYKERMERLGRTLARNQKTSRSWMDAAFECACEAAKPSEAPVAGNCRWIHYLGYVRADRVDGRSRTKIAEPPHYEGPVCTSLADLQDLLPSEREPDAQERNLVDLSRVRCHRFIDVILNAFSETSTAGADGWLDMDRETARLMLPTLQKLGDVFVATGKGGKSLDFVRDAECAFVPADMASSEQSMDDSSIPDQVELEALAVSLRRNKSTLG